MARKGADSPSGRMAKHMKEAGVTRDTGQCPWGCGRAVTNGGSGLLNHLRACKGRPKKR